MKTFLQLLVESKEDSSTIAIFRKHKGKVQVLIGEKRKDGLDFVLPGGHREDGESPLQAAIRELEEETGIKAKSLKRIGKRCIDGGRQDVLFAALIDNEGEPQAADDLMSVWWTDVDDLPKMSYDHEDIVKKAMKSLAL